MEDIDYRHTKHYFRVLSTKSIMMQWRKEIRGLQDDVGERLNETILWSFFRFGNFIANKREIGISEDCSLEFR